MDDRAHQRLIVEKEIECRIDGRREYAFLYDLSVGGCMIETAIGSVNKGDHVQLVLDNLDDVRGQVVWQYGGCAGIRFEQHLHDAVVKFLGFTPTVLTFEELTPRDRFGRQLPALQWL